VLLSIAVIAIGQILSRMVVRPLKSLEESMGVIAEGKFERVAIDSKDREIVSLTKAFNKMLKELELHERHLIQSEKLASLGTLLSGVAHELNNPLSNISSSNQILMEEFKEAREKRPAGPWPLDPDFSIELISQINDQTDRARNIVRSLLDFSRDREFKKEKLSLKRIFEETIQFVKGQVPTKIEITLAVADDIMIVADKQRIQQAFLNLVKNAIDAITSDGGTITIKAEKHRAIDDIEDEKIGIYNYLKYRGKCTLEEDTVDIEIRDSGPGIPLDILPKIFDPFFTTKDVGKGSGLGLFIVHEIIEEHDGCIAVDSEPGKGTTFLIRLPVRE
jgi:signal transduction histidine kinase